MGILLLSLLLLLFVLHEVFLFNYCLGMTLALALYKASLN